MVVRRTKGGRVSTRCRLALPGGEKTAVLCEQPGLTMTRSGNVIVPGHMLNAKEYIRCSRAGGHASYGCMITPP